MTARRPIAAPAPARKRASAARAPAPAPAPARTREARPALRLSLQFADPSHRDHLPRHRVARWIRAALEVPGTLTVRLVDEEEGRALNRDYRGKDYATNVLTFDYVSPSEEVPEVEADLVLCAPVVEREAKAQRTPLADHYAHLLVHGTLHAQGYDHEDDGPEAAAMEARETEILAALGIADPYAKD